MPPNKVVLAIDYGASRLGLALGNTSTALASPLGVIEVQATDVVTELKAVIEREGISQIVVGLPRGSDGQLTAQTKDTEKFTAMLKDKLKLPVDTQDESLTSVKAEQELKARRKTYTKADVDSLAATYILEDWLSGHLKQSKN